MTIVDCASLYLAGCRIHFIPDDICGLLKLEPCIIPRHKLHENHSFFDEDNSCAGFHKVYCEWSKIQFKFEMVMYILYFELREKIIHDYIQDSRQIRILLTLIHNDFDSRCLEERIIFS